MTKQNFTTQVRYNLAISTTNSLFANAHALQSNAAIVTTSQQTQTNKPEVC